MENPKLEIQHPKSLRAHLAKWFAAHGRDLPWRRTRDPYAIMVSEFMLQQTQVTTVIPYFERWLARFPDFRTLAAATEAEVLAQWQGLGYYSRARNLHRAAQHVVKDFGGALPPDPQAIAKLPGVGRYTAGAIASIVFGEPAPIVDGNVRRVLLRIDGQDLAEKEAEKWAWRRADELVALAADPAAFNEGLMELGATICTPAAPKCPACPLRTTCIARREGRQGSIPQPKKRASVSETHHGVVVIRDKSARLLVERRPDDGMWAGMWQAPTLEGDSIPDETALKRMSGAARLTFQGSFTHLTTHRMVHFHVWEGQGVRQSRTPRQWLDVAAVAKLALANPHRRILLGHDSVKRGNRGLDRADPSAMLSPLPPGPAR